MEDFFTGTRHFGELAVSKDYLEDAEYGSKLFHTEVTATDSRATASLLLVHGFAEHSQRYLHVAAAFARNKLHVHLFDFRGCGFSSGARFMASLKELQEDLVLALSKVHKGQPLFVLAHSMGGAVLLNFLRHNPELRLGGLMVVNPFIDFPENLKFGTLTCLAYLALPRVLDPLVLNTRIHPFLLSNSPPSIISTFTDRMLAPVSTVRALKTLVQLRFLLRAPQRLSFRPPVYFVAGGKDRLTPTRFLTAFFEQLPVAQKHLYFFDDGLHELLTGEESADVVALCTDWVYQKLSAAPAFEFPSSVRIVSSAFSVRKYVRLALLLLVLLVFAIRKQRLLAALLPFLRSRYSAAKN